MGTSGGGEEPSVKNKENIIKASMDLHIVQLHVMSGYKCAAINWEVGKILKQIKSDEAGICNRPLARCE